MRIVIDLPAAVPEERQPGIGWKLVSDLAAAGVVPDKLTWEAGEFDVG